MKQVFTSQEDLHDPVGQIRFGANSLEAFGEPTGLPDVRIMCPVQQDDGSYIVYGLWPTHDALRDRPWKLFRFRSYDGLHFDERELVYESIPGDWLGTCSLAQNTSDGSFLCLRWRREEHGHGLYAFGSDDGINWRPLSNRPVYQDHDAGKLMFDPRTGEYIVYQMTYQQHEKPYPDNCPENVRRVMHLRTSRDGLRWTPAEDANLFGPYPLEDNLITPDECDPPELEFYDFAAFPYLDRYVGMMQNYASSPRFAYPWSSHGPHLNTEWWTSRDGLNWQRPFRDVFAAGPSPWTIGCAPMNVNGRHIWIIKGKAYGLPEDRMFYVGALANGAFTTAPMTIRNATCPLLVNASLGFYGPGKHCGFKKQRYLLAELLDEQGEVIPGYGTRHCTIQNLDDGPTRLWWSTCSRMQRVNQTVRVRFYFRDARIYSIESIE